MYHFDFLSGADLGEYLGYDLGYDQGLDIDLMIGEIKASLTHRERITFDLVCLNGGRVVDLMARLEISKPTARKLIRQTKEHAKEYLSR